MASQLPPIDIRLQNSDVGEVFKYKINTLVDALNQNRSEFNAQLAAGEHASHVTQQITTMHTEVDAWHRQASNWHQSIASQHTDVTNWHNAVNQLHSQINQWQQQVSQHSSATAASESAAKQSEIAAKQSEHHAAQSATQAKHYRDETRLISGGSAPNSLRLGGETAEEWKNKLKAVERKARLRRLFNIH